MDACAPCEVDRAAAERQHRHDGKSEDQDSIAALITAELSETPHPALPRSVVFRTFARGAPANT
jgi:hypothetical protein